MADTNMSLVWQATYPPEARSHASSQTARRPRLQIVSPQGDRPDHLNQRNPALGVVIGVSAGLAFWGGLALLVLL